MHSEPARPEPTVAESAPSHERTDSIVISTPQPIKAVIPAALEMPDHLHYHTFIRSLQHVKVLVADLETTGRSPEHHRIVQAGFVPVDPHRGIIGGGYEQTINPLQPIPKHLNEGPERVYDITDKDVQSKPTFDAVAPQLAEIMDGKTVLFYNSDFDRPFLEEAFKKLGLSFEQLNVKILCLMKIAKGLQPPTASYSLDNAALARGINVSARKNAHGALLDAKYTAKLLPALSREYADAKAKYVVMTKKKKMPFVLPDAEQLFYPESAKAGVSALAPVRQALEGAAAAVSPFASVAARVTAPKRTLSAITPDLVTTAGVSKKPRATVPPRTDWYKQRPVSMLRDGATGEFRINFGERGVFGRRHFGKTLGAAEDSFFDFALNKMQPHRFTRDALEAIKAEAFKREIRSGKQPLQQPELEISASSQTTSRVTRSSARKLPARVPYERARADHQRHSSGL